jgi:hypothetical protein
VKGESFPASGGDAKNVGPELTGMGNQHPAEYFAESILAPNAVVLDGPGYIGPDGKSIMPSYADSLSVTQLVDLVAFIQSLTGGGHTHGAAPAEKSTEVYTVRLAYHGGDHAGHADHAATRPHGGCRGAGSPDGVRARSRDRRARAVPAGVGHDPDGGQARAADGASADGRRPGISLRRRRDLADGRAHDHRDDRCHRSPDDVDSEGPFAKPATLVFERGS